MINAVINVRKEKGMTSFGVVSRMRRIFDQKKIGHTGTLDPDAEGVLPVCFGRATKLVDTLSKGTKEYEAVILLGKTTDTQDVTGTVLKESDVLSTVSEIEEAIMSFVGKQTQIPPMYSAVKVGGKKLVDLARRGIEIERPSREVEFSEIKVKWIDPPRASFTVTCTHGTYIRTLCNDIGDRLGCGGCMESLLRTRVGEFVLAEALTIDEITALKAAEDGVRPESDNGSVFTSYTFAKQIDEFYPELPRVYVKEAFLKPVLNGLGFAAAESEGGTEVENGCEARVYTPNGDFIGIYERKGAKLRLVKFYYEDK